MTGAVRRQPVLKVNEPRPRDPPTDKMNSSGSSNDDKTTPAQGTAQERPQEGAAAGSRVPARRSYIQKMAHELKTPISAIVAASEIMRDEQLGPIGDERYRRYAADIHDSARLMLAIIDRMMAQRGRDAVQQPLEFVEVEPAELLHATVSSMQPLAERARVRVKVVEPPAKLPKVTADALTLKQILLNLITNSLKFTPESGEIVATATYLPDGELAFEVRDTGRGMDEAEIAEALKGLLPEGRERAGGGLGVGLPLVKNLAEANGARLEIESDPQKGTSARVVFPRERVIS